MAYNYLESPSKYFQTRAKLAAKLSRHRTVMDYRQSLLEADSLEVCLCEEGGVMLTSHDPPPLQHVPTYPQHTQPHTHTTTHTQPHNHNST